MNHYIMEKIIQHFNLTVYDNFFRTYYDDRVVFVDKRVVFIDDIIKYYVRDNHSKVESYNHFNLTCSEFSAIVKHYNIIKPKELSYEINKKTLSERYGSETYNNQEKMKQTCLERYGVDNVFKNPNFVVNGCMKKYGVTNPNKLKEVRDKIRNTCIERYGVDSPIKSQDILHKRNITNMEKFGGNSPMCSQEVVAKFDFKSSAKKAFDTKLRNGTTNTSKPQKYLIQSLKEIFGEGAVKCEYWSDVYPYHCDAYVESIDTFIELNLYFTHGGHLFDEANP